MLITCLGHSMFLMETANGTRIITDPTDAYPIEPSPADYVLISHHHHDHDHLASVSGYGTVLDSPEQDIRHQGIVCTGFPSFHDTVEGARRGKNTIWRIEADGLRVVHLGDLGHLPDQALIDAIGPVDILLVPVGGYYTISAEQAAETDKLLKPKVILPMHHRTEYVADWPIAPAEDFTERYPSDSVSVQPILRVTAQDISCVPHVIVLKPMLRG